MAEVAVYRFGGFELRPAEFALLRDGERVRISPKTFDVLRVLVERHGRLVEKDELLREVWPDTFVEDANLSVQVAALRRILGLPPSGGEYIETVPKRGYRFVAPVQRAAGGADTSAPADGVVPSPPVSRAGGHARLVVLPLTILRSDPDTDFLAFSLPDAIAAALADLPWLQVRSPHASQGRQGAENLAALAATTGATHALAGTLVRTHEGLRIGMQLLSLPDATVRWSESLTTSIDALFDVEQEAVHRVCRVLAAGGLSPRRERAQASTPHSAAGYALYLRANQLAYETSRWTDARDLYRACLDVDPGFAPAWAGLARCQRVIGKFAASDEEAAPLVREAEASFERALALDPDLSVAHNLYAQLEVDLGRAIDAMRRLIARARQRPLDPQLYAGLVHALRFCGLLDESVAAHARARELDATVPTSVHHTWWMLGDYGRALGETYGDIGYMPGLALASLGREAEAVAALRWRERETREPRIRWLLASLRALLEGNDAECLAALDQVTAGRLDAEALYYLGRTCVRLGQRDRGLALLERAVAGGFTCEAALSRDPWLSPAAADPRFVRLVERSRAGSARAQAAYQQAGGPDLLA